MSFEALLSEYQQIREQIEELEARRLELSERILYDMDDQKVEVGEFTVSKRRSFSIKMPIEEARALDATVMREMIDRKKIREMIDAGQTLEGVSESSYIQVTRR